MATVPPSVTLLPIAGIPEVAPGDDLAALILAAAGEQGTPPRAGDLLVVTQRVVSKAEGRVVPLAGFEPSPFALAWAARWQRDARQVEAVLRESARIVRQERGVLICQTHHGYICANAGVDLSNTGEPGDTLVSLLPVDPDASCRVLRDAVRARLGLEVGVVMTDTFGRPWREGQVNVAIGVAGLRPIVDLAGTLDADGRSLQVTAPCVADEVAAAAGLVMAKAARIPAVIVRGYPYVPGEGRASEIIRPPDRDLFR